VKTILIRLAKELGNDGRLTYDEAERKFLRGDMTTRRWMIYCLFFRWAAARFNESDGARQTRAWKRFGMPRLVARREMFLQALVAAQ
jgi:hypothetical protein